MKLRLSYIIISVLFISNFTIGIKYLYRNNYLQGAIKSCKSKLFEAKYINEYFLKSMEQQKETWNREIKDAADGISIENGTFLCLRISYRNCLQCVEMELQNLKNIEKLIGPERITLFVDFKDSTQMNYFLSEYKLSYKIIDCKYLNFELDKYNNPYYFILNEEKIQYPFIPIRDNPEIFNLYIQNALPIFNGFSLTTY